MRIYICKMLNNIIVNFVFIIIILMFFKGIYPIN